MFQSALAFLMSMILTFILGGLLGFGIRFFLAILFLPLITMLRKKDTNPTVIRSGPWILTIEFLANIFYGWFANYIGVWVFNSLGVTIDWFYPLTVFIGFIYFDLTKIHNEKKRLRELTDNNLNEKLPIELINQEMKEHRQNNFLNEHLNSRYTALFGKLSGVVIGGFNLIVLSN